MKLYFYIFLINILNNNIISFIFSILIIIFVINTIINKKIKIDELAKERDIKLTILVPVYNEEENLQNFIDNIHKNNQNFDVIFINDMSTDTSFDIINKNKKKYNYKIVNRNKKRGFVAGVLNDGLKYVNKESNFIGVIDSDSILSENLIDDVIDILKKKNIKIMNLSNYSYKIENFWQKISSLEKIFKNNLFLNLEASLNNGYFIEKKLLNNMNNWDETDITEDLNLNLKIKNTGYIIYQSNLFLKEYLPDNMIKYLNQRYRWVKGDILNRLKKFPKDFYEFILIIYYLIPFYTLYEIITLNFNLNIFFLQLLIIIAESIIYFKFNNYYIIIDALLYSTSNFIFYLYFYIRFILDVNIKW